MDNTWQNRIIAHGEEAPDQLLASPYQWKIHPKNQQEPLHAALETIGWLQDIIVNVRSGEEWTPEERNVQTVVDGHLRITLALRHDQPSVPVKYVDLSPSEEALALATLDPLAALAVADKEKLDGLLRELQPVDVRLQEMLAGLAKVEGLYGETMKEAVPPEEFQEYDEDIKTDYQCPKCNYCWSGSPK